MWCSIVFITFTSYVIVLMSETSPLNNVKISRLPKDYFPKSGSLQLICEAEGSPLPSIIWYDAQTMSPVEEERSIGLKIYKDIGLLMIQKPVEKEIYEFYCNASNGYYWVMSSTVKTGRAFLSSTFKVEPISIQVIKPLQTVSFSCQPPYGIPNPKIHWLKDKRLLLGKSFSKDKNRIFFVNKEKSNSDNDVWSLKITKSKVTDSGRYQCVATNDHGRVESSSSWLIVSNNLDTYFNIKIENIFIIHNHDVRLLCDTEYKNNIRWISSKTILQSSRINISSNWFNIKKVSILDKGLYACESNNSSPELLKIYRLNLGSSEVVDEKVKSRKKVVIEGVNVVLECDLENSQTEFYWETPNSQPLFPQDFSDNRIHVSSNGNLNIKNVQSSDSGKYTCNAHSSLDIAHKSIWLEVYKHQLELYPVISIPCQNATVLQGSNINLSCEVIGEDIIKIIWYKGLNIKQRLVNTQKTFFPTKDSLKIIDSNMKEDTNFYTCEAINDQGRKATWMSFVNVVDGYEFIKNNKQFADLPLPPVVESPKNIKSTTIDITWSSSSNNDMEIVYWIEYVYFGTNTGWTIYQKNWKKTYITIENLNPDTWYQFLVRSKNQAGIGRASVPTEYVKTQRDDKHFGNVGFSFSKIKLHIPTIESSNDMRLIWSLNRIANDEKYLMPVQFYLFYRPVSILQCIVAMSNGHEVDYNVQLHSLRNYCSLKFLTSEKLKFIKNNQSPIDVTSNKLLIDFNKTNLTKSKDINYESFAKMAWRMSDFTAFQCFNFSIISDKGFRSIYSNHRLVLTPEVKPSKAPENVEITWVLPEISISINWKLPHRKYWNGILTGSNIYMKSNESEIVLKYNNTKSNKLIKRVNSDLDWIFQISITNCMGESEKSFPMILKRLTSSMGVTRNYDSIFKKTWVIAIMIITSLLIWIMLCFLTIYLCCIRSNGIHGHKQMQMINSQETPTTKIMPTKENMIDKIVNNLKNDTIMHDSNEDKSSSNNCASSAKSSGQSSSPSSVSFCNPYASTQIFEGVHENKPIDMNLFYLSSPIFEPMPVNKIAPVPLNYYLSNVPDWVGNPILTGSFQQNPKIYPFHFPEEFRTNSNSDLSRTPKEKPNYPDTHTDDSGIGYPNGTISNLLMSTAPFSDQFSSSSKGKSTPNSSNSDSTHHLTHIDVISRYGPPNIHSKSMRRRQDVVDQCELSTEMTHLLIDNNDRNSPSIARVYDTPYSESSVDSRKNSQSKE